MDRGTGGGPSRPTAGTVARAPRDNSSGCVAGQASFPKRPYIEIDTFRYLLAGSDAGTFGGSVRAQVHGTGRGRLRLLARRPYRRAYRWSVASGPGRDLPRPATAHRPRPRPCRWRGSSPRVSDHTRRSAASQEDTEGASEPRGIGTRP